MDLRKVTERYLITFYWLGQSSYNPRMQSPINEEFKSKAVRFLPVISWAVVTSILSNYVLWDGFQRSYDRGSEMSISCIWYIVEHMMLIAVVSSSIRYGHLLSIVHKDLQMIQCMLKYKMKITLNTATFLGAYKRKIICILGLNLLSILGGLRQKINLLVSCLYKTQVFIELLVIFHAIFYIGILKMLLKHFGDHTEVLSKQHLNGFGSQYYEARAVISQLRLFRRTHYQLQKCASVIDKYFGWILLTSILYLFYSIVWSLYWAFVYVHMEHTCLNFLRKYEEGKDVRNSRSTLPSAK